MVSSAPFRLVSLYRSVRAAMTARTAFLEAASLKQGMVWDNTRYVAFTAASGKPESNGEICVIVISKRNLKFEGGKMVILNIFFACSITNHFRSLNGSKYVPFDFE